MRGNNTLLLNAATVIEALQEYFDRRSHDHVAEFAVKSVRHCTTDSDGFIEASVEGSE